MWRRVYPATTHDEQRSAEGVWRSFPHFTHAELPPTETYTPLPCLLAFYTLNDTPKALRRLMKEQPVQVPSGEFPSGCTPHDYIPSCLTQHTRSSPDVQQVLNKAVPSYCKMLHETLVKAYLVEGRHLEATPPLDATPPQAVGPEEQWQREVDVISLQKDVRWLLYTLHTTLERSYMTTQDQNSQKVMPEAAVVQPHQPVVLVNREGSAGSILSSLHLLTVRSLAALPELKLSEDTSVPTWLDVPSLLYLVLEAMDDETFAQLPHVVISQFLGTEYTESAPPAHSTDGPIPPQRENSKSNNVAAAHNNEEVEEAEEATDDDDNEPELYYHTSFQLPYGADWVQLFLQNSEI